MTTDHDEILRLRQRVDTLTEKLLGIGYMTDSHSRGIGYLRDEIRQAQAQLEGLEDKVAGMNHAEQIAAAVTAALKQSQRARWTAWQKIASGALVLIVALPAVAQVVGWFYH